MSDRDTSLSPPRRKSPLHSIAKSLASQNSSSSSLILQTDPVERDRIRRMSSASDATVDRSIIKRASMTLAGVASDIESKIPFEPIKVDHAKFETQCYSVIDAFFPQWKVFMTDDKPDTINPDITFVQMKDGITNKLMKCTNTITGQVVLIRTYGKKSEILIDRCLELINIRSLNRLGFAPPLYGRFLNGFLYGYFEGCRFSVEDMSDPVKSKLVARLLGKWHSSAVPGDKVPGLFTTLQKWLLGVPEVYSKPQVQELFVKYIRKVSDIEAELSALKIVMDMLESPIVFCHNDLLSGNIIYQPETSTVQFIDYEYGCYNYRGFDIGNHFCEFAGFDGDYSKYPGKEFQLEWLKSYLQSYLGFESVAEIQVYDLYVEVNIFALAAHMYWGVWALIQAQFSDIDFDYMGYAKLRFDQYYSMKPNVLELLEEPTSIE